MEKGWISRCFRQMIFFEDERAQPEGEMRGAQYFGKNVVFGPNIWPTLEPWVLRVATAGRRVGRQFSNQNVVWRVHDGSNNVDKCGTMF